MAATPEQWASARIKFETTPISGAKLSQELGVSGAALSKMAKRHAWVKFSAAVNPKVQATKAKQVKVNAAKAINTKKIDGNVIPLNSKGKPLQRTGEEVKALVKEANKQIRAWAVAHNSAAWEAWITEPDAMDEFTSYITTNGAEGSLAGFCREKGFGLSMLHSWICADPLRSESYTRAKKNRADTLFDALLGLSSELPERGPDGKVDAGWVQWKRLVVDTAKWGVAKLKPESYGERTDLHVTGNITTTIDRTALETEIRALAAKGMRTIEAGNVTDVEPKR